MPRFLPFAGLVACAPTAQTGPALQFALQDALSRAHAVNPRLLSASFAAQNAHEDTARAKAALLPNVRALSQQSNPTQTRTFVANNWPHIYSDLPMVHGDIYAPVQHADRYRSTIYAGERRLRSIMRTALAAGAGMIPPAFRWRRFEDAAPALHRGSAAFGHR
jgi:hypothetical protein